MKYDWLSIIFFIQSTIIVAILLTGFFKRKQRKKHAFLMRVGIIWDIVLVLQIELSRHAIDQAIHMERNTTLLNFHIAVSVLCTLLYFFLLYSGWQLLNNQKRGLRPYHLKLGYLTIICRLINYVTSFLI
ncbi:MAG: hypothetical protein H6621_07615 [Halobacteriovoraceae bacterium]|nr:hypothetical protein [Halobacteriovoraceae bacterium]